MIRTRMLRTGGMNRDDLFVSPLVSFLIGLLFVAIGAGLLDALVP